MFFNTILLFYRHVLKSYLNCCFVMNIFVLFAFLSAKLSSVKWLIVFGLKARNYFIILPSNSSFISLLTFFHFANSFTSIDISDHILPQHPLQGHHKHLQILHELWSCMYLGIIVLPCINTLTLCSHFNSHTSVFLWCPKSTDLNTLKYSFYYFFLKLLLSLLVFINLMSVSLYCQLSFQKLNYSSAWRGPSWNHSWLSFSVPCSYLCTASAMFPDWTWLLLFLL